MVFKNSKKIFIVFSYRFSAKLQQNKNIDIQIQQTKTKMLL